MHILYGSAMAAVFVLCLVLVWTVRKVLRPSPTPPAGEMSLARLHEAIERIDVSKEIDDAEIAQFDPEPEGGEISTSLLDPLGPEIMVPASSVANETTVTPIAPYFQEAMQPVIEMPLYAQPEAFAGAADVISEPEVTRNGEMEEHLAPEHNYILESLLLGVVVFVLLRTQRSKLRHERSLQSSDQVA